MKKILLLLSMVLVFKSPSIFAQEVVLKDTFSSDDQAFVQGLALWDKDRLLMGTGLYGKSAIGWLDLESGKFTPKEQLDATLFGEGVTVTPDVVWQFTWKKGKAFKRSKDDLAILEEVAYQGEGWGLAYDADRHVIWSSNGSANLTKRDADTFAVIETLAVTDNQQPLDLLNELEYANGQLYANIWMTNTIVAIDVTSGEVVRKWDLTPLVETLSFSDSNPDRVLNGIAHIEEDEFYVTGKLYPVIWRVQLQ